MSARTPSNFKNFFSPGSSFVRSTSFSTNSTFFAWPEISRRFNTISSPNVAKSISQALDQRLQKRRAVLLRNVEHIRVQKLQYADSQSLITSPRQMGHRAQPLLVVQFVLRDLLHHIQQLLRHQPFHVAERVRLEYRSYLSFFAGRTFFQNQLANILQQRHRFRRQSSSSLLRCVDAPPVPPACLGEASETARSFRKCRFGLARVATFLRLNNCEM